MDRKEVIGGGVAIYIRNDINSFSIEEPSLTSSSCEQIWCTIRVGTEKILLGCIYRPPSAQYECSQSIIHSLKIATKLIYQNKYSSLLVSGDFNHDDIIWDNLGGSTKGTGKRSSLDMLNAVSYFTHLALLAYLMT